MNPLLAKKIVRPAIPDKPLFNIDIFPCKPRQAQLVNLVVVVQVERHQIPWLINPPSFSGDYVVITSLSRPVTAGQARFVDALIVFIRRHDYLIPIA